MQDWCGILFYKIKCIEFFGFIANFYCLFFAVLDFGKTQNKGVWTLLAACWYLRSLPGPVGVDAGRQLPHEPPARLYVHQICVWRRHLQIGGRFSVIPRLVEVVIMCVFGVATPSLGWAGGWGEIQTSSGTNQNFVLEKYWNLNLL